MKITQWPNALGYDVGCHEVWLLPDGTFGVRRFFKGWPHKSLKVAPTAGLPIEMQLVAAVDMCRDAGKVIE